MISPTKDSRELINREDNRGTHVDSLPGSRESWPERGAPSQAEFVKSSLVGGGGWLWPLMLWVQVFQDQPSTQDKSLEHPKCLREEIRHKCGSRETGWEVEVVLSPMASLFIPYLLPWAPLWTPSCAPSRFLINSSRKGIPNLDTLCATLEYEDHSRKQVPREETQSGR